MFGPIPAVAPVVDGTPHEYKRNMDYFFTHLAEEPLQLYCPNCRTNVLTNIMYKPGGLTCLLSTLGLLLGPCLCCCLWPCFMNRFKNVLHVCPNCAQRIGTKHRLGANK